MVDKREIFRESSSSYPVYYEDTDLSGFVYHANYLKYFERAREDLIGIDWLVSMRERGIHFVVARSNLKYHKPARHGDRIDVLSKVTLSRSPVSRYRQEAWVNGELYVGADIDIAALNNANKPVRMPEDVVDAWYQEHA